MERRGDRALIPSRPFLQGFRFFLCFVKCPVCAQAAKTKCSCQVSISFTQCGRRRRPQKCGKKSLLSLFLFLPLNSQLPIAKCPSFEDSRRRCRRHRSRRRRGTTVSRIIAAEAAERKLCRRRKMESSSSSPLLGLGSPWENGTREPGDFWV